MVFFLDKPGLSERNPLYLQIMRIFQRNPFYLRETHIIWSDNVSFSRKTHFILEKHTLSADDVSFFSEKPTSSADNAEFSRKTYSLSVISPPYLIIVTTACHACMAEKKPMQHISSKHCFRSLCIRNLYLNLKDKFSFVYPRKISWNGENAQNYLWKYWKTDYSLQTIVGQ